MTRADNRKWHRYLSFWRADIAADVDAELAFHVDARTEELCSAASERRAHFARDMLGDVRVAVRALRRSPGLVAVVGLTFALGIGVTGAMYSVVDNFLFKALPGAHGSSLVVLGRT